MFLLLLLLLSLGGSESPKDAYRLQVSLSETVQEGLCIYIPCTFFYPKPWSSSDIIYGYWFKRRPVYPENVLVATNNQNHEVEKEAMGRFHLVGDPMKDNCSLSITDVQKKDSGQYFFHMERGWTEKYSYLKYQVNLNVRALTEKPDIYIPGTLEPGHLVKVICVAPSVSECGKAPVFSWTGAILSSLEFLRETLHFSELTLTPGPQDHGSNLTCQVTFPGTRVCLERTVMMVGEQKSSWPLLLTLLRGVLMGIGFLLTYGVTYFWYSRKRNN